MLKPAQAQTKTGRITVLATPGTLRSKRYQELKQLFAHVSTVDEPDTIDWARKIEDGLAHEIDLSELHGSISNGSDTLVLACTHYIGIKDHLQKAYPAVAILEPSGDIAERLMQLLPRHSH